MCPAARPVWPENRWYTSWPRKSFTWSRWRQVDLVKAGSIRDKQTLRAIQEQLGSKINELYEMNDKLADVLQQNHWVVCERFTNHCHTSSRSRIYTTNTYKSSSSSISRIYYWPIQIFIVGLEETRMLLKGITGRCKDADQKKLFLDDVVDMLEWYLAIHVDISDTVLVL